MRWCLVFMAVYHSAAAQFPNILIGREQQPGGLTIAIHPKNTKHIVAATDRGSAWYSGNGGYTWTKTTPQCQAFTLERDPFLVWDTSKTVLYTVCTASGIAVSHSKGEGEWSIGCGYFGKNENQLPYRQRLCVNRKNNTIHAAWTEFAGDKKNNCSTRVRYCQSVDGGHQWSQPKTISSSAGNCFKGGDSVLNAASICTGPGNEIYVSWSGPEGLMFNRSVDGGNNWLPKEKIILPFKFGWNYRINGKHNANGLPSMACDNSEGKYKGRMYVCWSDDKNGANNKDVFLAYSDDQGENWTDPVLVTYHPNHKEQFLPVLGVDQSNGKVYILYYDQRNSCNNDLTDVYLAVSNNGGLKFDLYKLNERSFSLMEKDSYGSYLGLSVENGEARPLWARREGKKEWQVYTAVVNDSTIGRYNARAFVKEIEMEKTFRFGDEIKINFKNSKKLKITAMITKPLAPGFEKTVLKNKIFNTGNNELIVKSKDLGLEKGSYVVTLYFNGKNEFAWITEE